MIYQLAGRSKRLVCAEAAQARERCVLICVSSWTRAELVSVGDVRLAPVCSVAGLCGCLAGGGSRSERLVCAEAAQARAVLKRLGLDTRRDCQRWGRPACPCLLRSRPPFAPSLVFVADWREGVDIA